MHRCTQHPNTRAAWICSKCEAACCPQCVARDTIQRSEFVRCLSCGGIAETIMVQKQIEPYWRMLGPFLQAIFSLAGLVQLLVVAGMMVLISFVPIVGGILALGIYAAYYFLVINRFAYGEEKLPNPAGFSDIMDDILVPFVRFVLATIMLWLPAVLYISTRIGMGTYLADPLNLHGDPILLLIALACALIFPAAMITAAITDNTMAMLNPLMLLGIILRIPRDYILTALVWGVLTLAGMWLSGLMANFLYAHSIFIITPILHQAVGLIAPLLTAMILGRLVYQNREVLEVGHKVDMMEPEFPNAQPEGSLPEKGFEPEPAKAPVREPITLDPEDEPPMGVNPQADLVSALAAGNATTALAAYADLRLADLFPMLSPQQDLQLAAMLEKAGKSLDAVHACRRAAKADMSTPLAAKAIFAAGRLLTEKLNQQQQGLNMYRHVAQNFPKDPIGIRAQEILREFESS